MTSEEAKSLKIKNAYRAWQRAVERGYGKTGYATPTGMSKVDANIRRLKAKYEAALRA